MAVLVEGLSVVIKRSAVDAKYPGGWNSFVTMVQNNTFCYDDRLARLGFSGPPEVETFINRIESMGLTYLDGDRAVDMVVVDQDSGFVAACEWAKFGHGNLGGDPKQRVAGCQGVNGANAKLITPEGWTFDGSISQQFPIETARH